MYQRPPEHRGRHQPSYDSAFRKTFNTTYGNSYQDVDTIHSSPVYRERLDQNQSPAYYSHTSEYRDYGPSPRHMAAMERHHMSPPMEPPRSHQYYDYYDDRQSQIQPPNTEHLRHPDRPTGSEYVRRRVYNDMLARPDERNAGPIGKNACVYCQGPEMHIPKCTNQLGCVHKYCDACLRQLHAVDGPFRDKTELYYYCAICRNTSRTPAPKIIRFDPYGRRMLKYTDVDNYRVKDD